MWLAGVEGIAGVDGVKQHDPTMIGIEPASQLVT